MLAMAVALVVGVTSAFAQKPSGGEWHDSPVNSEGFVGAVWQCRELIVNNRQRGGAKRKPLALHLQQSREARGASQHGA